MVEERELDGETWEARRQFVYGGLYIDEPLIFDKDTDSDGDCVDAGGSSRFFYAQQANFNVVAVTASDGTVVEKITYDPYGEATVTVAGGQSASGSPYLFQGRRWDGEADLYYFRNRSLSPRLGRFLQRDPIGYADGMDLYAVRFIVNGSDPHGLDDGFSLKNFLTSTGTAVEQYRNIERQWENPALQDLAARNRKFLSNPYIKFAAVLGNCVADIGQDIPNLLSADCDIRAALDVRKKRGSCCRKQNGKEYEIKYEQAEVCVRPSAIRVRCKVKTTIQESEECPPGWATSVMLGKGIAANIPGTGGLVKVSADVRVEIKRKKGGVGKVTSQVGGSVSVISLPGPLKKVCAYAPARVISKKEVK